jgi:hypothetical protein
MFRERSVTRYEQHEDALKRSFRNQKGRGFRALKEGASRIFEGPPLRTTPIIARPRISVVVT